MNTGQIARSPGRVRWYPARRDAVPAGPAFRAVPAADRWRIARAFFFSAVLTEAEARRSGVSGFVVVWEGRASIWYEKRPASRVVAPGAGLVCLKTGAGWVAVGGTDDTGADHWEGVTA